MAHPKRDEDRVRDIRARVNAGANLTNADARFLLQELATWRESCRDWHDRYLETEREARKIKADVGAFMRDLVPKVANANRKPDGAA